MPRRHGSHVVMVAWAITLAALGGGLAGPGKFNSAHGLAVDPTNGDVWIGDREDYRIVV